ncbi:hypothetical protein LCGC14_0946320 [marine sediment metagenome]|uniref:FUZ/MON1/HPS1 first Longin domain-containing protein n=1 Tax=marine sediment metagenome TaxID=412755 RepID=A0A0F9NIQ0_9ZZZZ
MKEVYEIGFVFRGFVLVSCIFKELSVLKEHDINQDLRGAFISAINAFTETAFNNSSIEYLESGNTLFIFKIGEVQSEDNHVKEAIILYGLVDKSKKKSDKLVRKFFEKVNPIFQLFTQKFSGTNFSELNQFEDFKDIMHNFFVKKIQA